MLTWSERLFGEWNNSQNSKALLIEATSSNVTFHQLCVYALIVTKAKNLTPFFLAKKGEVQSTKAKAARYFNNFQVVQVCRISSARKAWLIFISLILWARQAFLGQLVSLTMRGLQIGDVVYDQYLAGEHKASLDRFDWRVAKYIYIVLREMAIAETTLNSVDAGAVLGSHRVGISAAPYAIQCERLNLDFYSFGGGEYGTLIRSTIRKVYEYRVVQDEIAHILDLQVKDFENLYNNICKDLLLGSFNADSKLAFSNKLYDNRAEFASAYGLDPGKKNVFIMLHAFTDYPHSHFNGMIFKDFYDWFIKTLDHGVRNSNVNWIVKQHPSSDYYPVVDVDWNLIEKKYASSNVVFISKKNQFDSRTISHIGDAVITCLGSAGFEFSAFAGIPSISASDNPYATVGFAIVPKTKNEYFEVLNKVHLIPKLTSAQLILAKATFMFIHRLSRVKMDAIPNISFNDNLRMGGSNEYFEIADNKIDNEIKVVKLQINQYVDRVRSEAFKSLRTIVVNGGEID
jgi:hypothetical protein